MTASAPDPQLLGGGVLRVWAGGEVVGAAFLVAPDLVATAAPVSGPPAGPGTSNPTVWLDFPLLRDADDAPVRVRARIERPPVGPGHPALLRLVDPVPPAARMPPLRRVDRLADRTFLVLGFPAGLTDGLWSTGRIDPEHRLQPAPGEPALAAGFAGAPVWAADLGAVVGMAVPTSGTTSVLPIDQVLGFDPEWLPGPYRGLQPFDEEHADTFFGRDEEITRLVDLVARCPVVAVAGPSGAGKSSLVRAGLVPRLRAGGARVEYLRADTTPDDALPGPGADPDGPELVLVLDQFEELAALDPVRARALLAAIVAHTDPARGRPVRAVLTLRWNSLDELSTPELVEPLAAGTVLVGPLGREQLRAAIVEPARRPPGLGFEPGLVEAILDDAGAEPGRLPLVESLLAQLWARRTGGFLTLAGYAAAGGVAGALARHADEVVDALPPGSSDALRRLLTTLARPDADGRLVRRPVPADQLPADQRALLPGLTAGRLLTVSPAGGDDQAGGAGSSGRAGAAGDTVELAHQALLEHWPRLRDWLDADREFLAWRERVGAGRERWEDEDRADAALLRGATLAGAAQWLPARAAELTEADRGYLRRSTAHRRREVRRWQLVAAVVAVLALGAGALAAVTVRSGNAVAAQLAVANADALGREAQNRVPDDPAVAAQLALAAWRSDPRNPQARTALLQSYVALRGVERELPGLTTAPITDLLVGGDTALLVASPHPVVVTGLSGPAPQHRELTDVGFDKQPRLSPDGRWLTAQKPDLSGMILLDLVGGGPPVELPATPGTQAAGASFAPDSRRLSWIEVDGANQATVRIRDVETGAEIPHRLGVLPANVSGVSLTSDPGRVLVRREPPDLVSTRLSVHALADGAELGTFPEGTQLVLGGAAVSTCEPVVGPAPANGFGSPPESGVVVLTPLDGSTIRRIPITSTCDDGRGHLSSTGRAVVERQSGRTWRVTDLRTGQAFHVALPDDPATDSLIGFPEALTFDVPDTRPDGAAPGALLAVGTTLLRLRAEPVPRTVDAAAGESIVGITDRYHLVRTANRGFRTVENSTGIPLGEVTDLIQRGTNAFWDDTALWAAQRGTDGWRLTRYALPQLQPGLQIQLPGRPGASPPADAPQQISIEQGTADGPLAVLADGVLSAWNPTTGQPLGPPVPLGDTEEQVGFYRGSPRLFSRPGHPDQFGVLGEADLQVWDVRAGRPVARVPATADPSTVSLGRPTYAFDPTGARLAVLTPDQRVQVWDVATAAQVRPPVPTPNITSLAGITSDGYLVTVGGDSPYRMAFVDLGTGFEAGSLNTNDDLPQLEAQGLDDTGEHVKLQSDDDALYLGLPTTGQGWRDALCAAVGRPFTPVEQDLLPPGMPTDPPCEANGR